MGPKSVSLLIYDNLKTCLLKISFNGDNDLPILSVSVLISYFMAAWWHQKPVCNKINNKKHVWLCSQRSACWWYITVWYKDIVGQTITKSVSCIYVCTGI